MTSSQPPEPWCLFLDRDGVINRRIAGDYVRTTRQWEYLPGAIQALRLLSEWAPRIVIVTNQRGVGRGLVSPEDLDSVHARLLDDVATAGARVDAIRVCPHLETDECSCRKPLPGLALSWLAVNREVNPARSVMVGDSPSDMGMAENLAAATGGCVRVLIDDRSDPALTGVDTDFRFPTLLDYARNVST
ncbi:D-glycero-alpha-D-manno-heptose-1,7-bisphosphate 7-phosphatase [Leifsonia sp. NPDC056824]|uniref:D-glycero-alpha-D-manno-heptose-1,7-bisphosphate 7-phosphatase n=1 Tax=Leifsonia sp. NPDC056824 TaxID=3345953 RepID=UPI0036B3930D